ncbi:hypothetical protein CI238_13304, partial [Colletotrichum incanum]
LLEMNQGNVVTNNCHTPQRGPNGDADDVVYLGTFPATSSPKTPTSWLCHGAACIRARQKSRLWGRRNDVKVSQKRKAGCKASPFETPTRCMKLGSPSDKHGEAVYGYLNRKGTFRYRTGSGSPSVIHYEEIMFRPEFKGLEKKGLKERFLRILKNYNHSQLSSGEI